MKATSLLLFILCLVCSCNGSQTELIRSEQIRGDSLPLPLTAIPGNKAAGRLVFEQREAGHCSLCHQLSSLQLDSPGLFGPSLDGVGTYLSEGQLRLRIVDYQKVLPGAPMPSYYRVDKLHQVARPYRGKPILSAQQVEDLVAFLAAEKDDEHAS